MNKLKLFIGVGICSILFTGCGFFEDVFGDKMRYSLSADARCMPKDLVERLAGKRYYYGFGATYESSEKNFEYYTNSRYLIVFKDDRYDGTGIIKCDDLAIRYYNEALKNAKTLPTNIKEEIAFEKEWLICDVMPSWLETKLDEYIKQNKNDDIAYINASKFKGAWNEKLSGKLKYKYGSEIPARNLQMSRCVATKTAIQAIENDLINLGNGKKAKCADLSYDDAPKCLDYFISVYDKAYKDKKSELDAEQKEIDIKKERKKYEQKNKQ